MFDDDRNCSRFIISSENQHYNHIQKIFLFSNFSLICKCIVILINKNFKLFYSSIHPKIYFLFDLQVSYILSTSFLQFWI